MADAPAGTLYLVNGSMAAEVLAASGLAAPEQILILHDVLSVGRLEALDDRTAFPAWCQRREGTWRTLCASLDIPFSGFVDHERDLYLATDRLLAAPQLVLCVGTGLSDQLTAAFVHHWCGLNGLPPGVLQEACWSPPPDGEILVGLPHLTPDELAAHYAPRPAVERAELRRRLWAAAVAESPEALVALAHRAAAQPLGTAVQAWLGRFPLASTGLSAWETRLLEAAHSGSVREVIGQVLRTHWNDPDPVGDLVLRGWLKELAERPDPAVRLHGAGLDAAVERLPAGTRALAGEAPLSRSPVATWVGGTAVHIDEGFAWARTDQGLAPGPVP